MTGIVKIVFNQTQECFIGYSRNCEAVLQQYEDHANDESKKNTNRLHDLIAEYGAKAFSVEVIKEMAKGTSDELLRKEKAKAIKEHNPTLNSYKDKNARITTPLEEVMEEISSLREEVLMGEDNGVIASLIESKFHRIEDSFLTPIYNKLTEIAMLLRKEK